MARLPRQPFARLRIRRPAAFDAMVTSVNARPWPRIRAMLFGSRRAVVRTSLVGAMLVLGVAAAGVATVMAYGEFGYHPDRNARAWAGLAPQYASSDSCTECHPSHYADWAGTAHRGIACESCHGPLPHDPNGPRTLRTSTASGQLCIACHATIVGRPSSFPQQRISTHYAGATCVQCHDPHSPVGITPTAVAHPLANLPPCTTCHRTDGLQPLPAGHVQATDRICLACHQPARADS